VKEVIVIGAGPAGSLAALLLARAHRRVTLLEQHAFPRDKVCGECLSSRGIDVLRRTGLYEALCTAHPMELRLVNLHAAGGRSLSLQLPRPMMGVSRQLLDGFLLEQAAQAGATVRQRIRCEGIDVSDRPQVRVRDLATNHVQTLVAGQVVVADGKRALIGDPPPHTGDFGVKSHFRGVAGPRDAIEMFGCIGCYGGIAAIEQERWNVSFSVPAARLKVVGSRLDQLLDQLLNENPVLRARLGGAERCSPWLTSPVQRFSPGRVASPNIVCVGNGSAATEPICGEGMGNALHSSQVAVAAMLNADGSSKGRSGRFGAGARDTAMAIRRTACRAAAVVASSPPAARLALGMLENFGLGGSVLWLMGKN
jgi:menaquinone-9 beta-reductase